MFDCGIDADNGDGQPRGQCRRMRGRSAGNMPQAAFWLGRRIYQSPHGSRPENSEREHGRYDGCSYAKVCLDHRRVYVHSKSGCPRIRFSTMRYSSRSENRCLRYAAPAIARSAAEAKISMVAAASPPAPVLGTPGVVVDVVVARVVVPVVAPVVVLVVPVVVCANAGLAMRSAVPRTVAPASFLRSIVECITICNLRSFRNARPPALYRTRVNHR